MSKKSTPKLIQLVEQVTACRRCEEELPLGPNPVLRVSETARLLIIGQAPGTKVHNTSIPWNDPSGDRLRSWLTMDRDTFYDVEKIAIMPMGFCYPGKGKSGDLPPRPECAPTWHHQLLQLMPEIRLTLLIGQYAQQYYLQDNYKTLTERVKNWQQCLPSLFPLPHPSPRNTLWLRKNPWFEEKVVPSLREQVQKVFCS
ncbi:uracil-DNA glycosylase family protein [Endozoicomonas sp. SM1973]|uniref:Uracil-DNA glycosylase family protein n=1 Tax=Spartinivicinus marinus TaxID=2994442 RepID=A0A853ILL9_9GAMM|nr:uracil-DNA glycosylase family protein [Spartinivicinus marinus]MCX4025830.1 uracil-DNA glycosylase family protein [Spartinivicinus marinus]NYZ68646.1 uracil-DNA glycosylase family protein [Spartinivicinus marinus]